MAVSCTGELAASIVKNCASPNVAGNSGRIIFIPRAKNPDIVKNANNPRVITNISIQDDTNAIFQVENLTNDPFNGAQTELNTNGGWPKYTKTVPVRIPLRGADVSKDIIEPLVTSPLGGILIIEKRYTGGMGAFEVVGIENGVKATAATHNEYENDADWVETLTTTENYAEYSFWDTDYATTKAKFEALWTRGV